jgi:hypothetical protein
MARLTNARDLTAIITAADSWINTSVINDQSVFSDQARWTLPLIDELHDAFVNQPDFGADSFIAKLKNQLKNTSPDTKKLAAEFLWVLLLFPSNMKAVTKRQQIREIYGLSGDQLPEDNPALSDDILIGIGSGGPGFNTYRPNELAFLIEVVRDLKRRGSDERELSLRNYDAFFTWLKKVPQEGHRQFRHMLRYFAFPDRVERMSSNNDRHKILEAFEVGTVKQIQLMSDRQLDEALLTLRTQLQDKYVGQILDFYEQPLRAEWSSDQKVKTPAGEVTVTIPNDDDDQDTLDPTADPLKAPDPRQSIQMQAHLAEIGAVMGYKIWIPRSDRVRVKELLSKNAILGCLEDLPLNYDTATLDTIEQIDILWLKGRSIARAFEVEHTTAVYSGLLRMADLLALQPNMDIRLHIVAPAERREKVFREMLRPVFSLLDRGPLSRSCTFISYDSVDVIRKIGYLAHTNDSIIAEFEEKAEA